MKLRGKGNKDIAVEQAKQTNRENRSPGTAMISQYQTDESHNNSGLNIPKQGQLAPFTANAGFQANRRQHQSSQAADRLSFAVGPHQSILRSRHPTLKARQNPKITPQQQNLKHSQFLNRPVNVLMPTQYQPQVEVMLNQNAVLMSKRAQEINKTVYLKNRCHQEAQPVQALALPSRPRTIEQPSRREALKVSTERARADTLNKESPSPLTNLLEAETRKQDDDVRNEMNKMKIKAAGLTRSAEGRLPKLATEEQGADDLAGAPAVRVKIVRADETTAQLMTNANSVRGHQARASPNLTFHHTSR